jgi:hypothetical protein
MDWKTQLATFIELRLPRRFKWGKHDCCLFACDAWDQAFGVDIAEWFRGRYSTKEEADKLLEEFAGGGLSKTMTKLARQFKLQKIERPFLQSGDLCLVKTDLGDALGICWNGRIVAQGPKNLVMLPKMLVKRAWRYRK